ncbi:fatty acid desaturase family protein [Leptothrix sp. BB-4]
MVTPSDITTDLLALRAQLQSQDRGPAGSYRELLRPDLRRPVLDLAVDLLVIAASISAVEVWGLVTLPLALLLLGNRQRAMGNLLHDAGHGNLDRRRAVNDSLARGLIAPMLFADLALYRRTHFRHHQWLGRETSDPDFIVPPQQLPAHWWTRYRVCATSMSGWWGSVWGHLVHPEAHASCRWIIVGWWVLALSLVAVLVGPLVALHAAGLWLLARATTFHAITTFREMCDHHGLQAGGVFSFTRDVIGHRFLRTVIHPRQNGYHLTHHLLPAVPYHRLPQAHALLQGLPLVRQRGQVCDAYLFGPGAVVRSWERGPRP